MNESETQSLRKENAQQYKHITELEAKVYRLQRRVLAVEAEYKARCAETADEWRKELKMREQAEAVIAELMTENERR